MAEKTALSMSKTGPKMGDVPSTVGTKLTPRKSLPINDGVSTPTTGKMNPMSNIKDKSDYGKGGMGGGTVC